MRTLQEIKKDPLTIGRTASEIIKCLEEGLLLDDPEVEKRVFKRYKIGKHKSPCEIRGSIESTRKFLRQALADGVDLKV